MYTWYFTNGDNEIGLGTTLDIFSILKHWSSEYHGPCFET